MTTPSGSPQQEPLNRSQLDAALDLVLTDEQWAAVSAEVEPAVIVAGAGSGKTTSMAARVAWLVGSGIHAPDAVLGLTFTTKATAQLLTSMRASLAALAVQGLTRVEDDDGNPVGEPQVLTYHAFAARIVSEHGIRLGREPGATMLSDGARQQLAYRVVCRTSLPLGSLGRRPEAITGELLNLDDELTELGIGPTQLRDFDSTQSAMLRSFAPLQKIGADMLAASNQRMVLAELVGEWRAAKAARDVMDFADQIRLAGEIVERYPDVVADLRTRYQVVLLDEYQDTSIAQRLLLQRVFGAGHPVMAVGDPCQAIYGWRGASVDNIESFPQHFRVFGPDGLPVRDAGRYVLSQNRRSGPNILEIANRTSMELRAAHTGVEPLAAGDNAKGPGRVSCALLESYSDEVEWLAERIDATRRGGVGWKDIAVLAATGRDLVAVDTALRLRGIPTQLVGAAALLSQPAVIDLRSMLQVIHDPTANPAFVRLAAGPRWRIGARDLAALGRRAADLAGGQHRSGQEDIASALDDAVSGSDIVEAVSLSEALESLGPPDRYSDAAHARFREMAAELRALRRHLGEPLPELVMRVMRITGLEVEVALGPPEVAAQQQHALATFLDLAADFTELDGRMTVGAFLSRLRDAERFDVDLKLDASGPAEAVQLLTVHKAKGLEFAHVFVPFVAKGAFPGGRNRAQWPTSASTVPWPLRSDATDGLTSFPSLTEGPRAMHYDEYKKVLKAVAELDDQRLAYVAFTRAERALTVSGHWWGPTQSKPRGPDRFLSVVYEACRDGAGEVVTWAAAPLEDAVSPEVERVAGAARWPAIPSADRLVAVRAVADAVDGSAALPSTLADDDSRASIALIEHWDAMAAALVEEARARQSRERIVRLPDSVSASLLMRALSDPDTVAMDLLRPMPRPPAPAARRGTQFHAWVETRYGQQSLLDPDDLPGSGDQDIVSDEALAALKTAFEGGPYGHLVPVAVEEPFAVLVGGRVINGRIDAVFDIDGRYDVIDWKTGSARNVQAMQLALYRVAWAQLRGVPVEDVDAAFVMVETGEIIRPDTAAELALLTPLLTPLLRR